MTERKMTARQEKKLRILVSAQKIFLEKGYHKTTIEDITNHAGIGKSTFYEYYDSKEEILKFLVDFAGANFLTMLNREVCACATARAKVQRLVYCCLLVSDLDHDGVNLYGYLLMNLSIREFSAYFQENFLDLFQAMVRNILVTGMNAGEIREEDADSLALMLLGMIGGLIGADCCRETSPLVLGAPSGEVSVCGLCPLPENEFFQNRAAMMTDLFFDGVAVR